MTEPQTWRILGNADAHELVLAVDFDATGRAEGRFTDLAAGPGWEARRVREEGV